MPKRLLGLVSFFVLLGALVVALVLRGQAAASSVPHLNYGAQLNAAQCGQGGTLVVDVTLKIINDPDSSVTGHSWANDSFNKHIQVWQTGASDFCAIVRYEGSFVTVAGNSPQDTIPNLAAGITGNIHGGYHVTFSGTLAANPAQPTSGNLGTFDYGWNGTDAGVGNLHSFDWSQVYFGTGDLNWVWWGWIYQAPGHGTWVNASTGNAGDIM